MLQKPQAWNRRHFFSLGLLRSSACQGVLLLATHPWPTLLWRRPLAMFKRLGCVCVCGVSSSSSTFSSSLRFLGFLQGTQQEAIIITRNQQVCCLTLQVSPPAGAPQGLPSFFFFRRQCPQVSPCCLIRSFMDKQWLFSLTALSSSVSGP